MMNRGYFKLPFKERIKRFFIKDDILSFLKLMRKCQYYSHSDGLGGGKIYLLYNKI